jgi:MFS family permease
LKVYPDVFPAPSKQIRAASVYIDSGNRFIHDDTQHVCAMAADLQTDYTLVSLSVGTYLAAMIIVQLIVGPLSDRVLDSPFGWRSSVSGAITVAIGAPLSMFTGAVLPETSASTVLLLLMLGVSVLGLLSVIWASYL